MNARKSPHWMRWRGWMYVLPFAAAFLTVIVWRALD